MRPSRFALAASLALASVVHAAPPAAPPSTNPATAPLPTLSATTTAPAATTSTGNGIDAAGQAPIPGGPTGDRVRARDRALDESFRQAIDRAAAQIFEPAALLERAAVLRLKVYPRARSYVTSYRVVEEGEQGGSFHVHIVAEVALARLEHDLSATPPVKAAAGAADGAHRGSAVMCVLALTPGGLDDPAVGAARDAITARLAAALRAHDTDAKAAPEACAATGTSAQDGSLDGAHAATVARATSTDAALVGSIRLAPDGTIRGTSLIAARAAVRLTLVAPDGRVAGEALAQESGYGADPAQAGVQATDAAVTAALATLDSALAARWPSPPPQPPAPSLIVHVGDWLRYADLDALMKSLSAIPGVAAVAPLRFVPGAADLQVRSPMSAAALVAALARIPGGRYRAQAGGDGSVTVRIAPDPAAPLSPPTQSSSGEDPAGGVALPPPPPLP